MKECIFCQIIKDQQRGDYLIYEDKNFIALPDICQLTQGHTLVIPKKHYRFVWDVENIGEYFEVCQKVTKKLQKVYNIKQIYKKCRSHRW